MSEQTTAPGIDGGRTEGAESRFGFRSALRAFRHRNYRLFFGGQFISLTGTWMQSLAQAWLVYRLTNNPVLLGFVPFCSQIPVLILAPLGGAVADRHRRRRILIITQSLAMILAFILAMLTLTGLIEVWQIFVIASLLGIVNAFDIPTRQAFIVEMVGREDLMNAIALNSSMVNGARVMGPAIAGVLVATVGEGWCFMANSVSYIAVIIGIILMQMKDAEPVSRRGSAFASIIEGFHYVRRSKPIRSLLMLLGLISLMGMPYMVLMPIFARDVLCGGPRAQGMLMGAAGLGALLGALVLAARKNVFGLGRVVVLASAGFGAFLILFAYSREFWVSVVLLVPAGFCMITEMATTNTLIQTMVPDNLRGRVMAVYSMMFMGMAPFGAMFAGLLTKMFGAPATVMFGGTMCIIGALVFALFNPLRSAPELQEKPAPVHS